MNIIRFASRLVLTLLLFSCSRNEPPKPPPPPDPPKVTNFTNPVFKPILADPTVVRDETNGYFYAYGTEDYWNTDGQNHLVAIVRSKDLVSWSYVGDAFPTRPTWKGEGSIWAPDVNYVNGKYHMYYSYSTWGDANPGIGLAVANSPQGPFMDMGKVFLSSEVGVRNSIDPFYYEEGGKKYLFWGSYNSGNTSIPLVGTYVTELSQDGKSVLNFNNKTKIAASDFEAVMIHKRGDYYYFFGSKGGCCAGANSTYNVRVGRSISLTGPYLDKDGKDLAMSIGVGTLVLSKSLKFVGPGHNSKIITDKNGQDWILYHAMNLNETSINGVNQRALMLDKVNWDANAWPIINDGTPSEKSDKKPVFQ